MEVLDYLALTIAFLKALLLPVVPAAVVIAFLIDQGLKRLPFWQDGWGGYASLILNMLFSAGLFAFAYFGKSEEFLNVVSQVGVVFTLLLTIGGGFIVTGKAHEIAVDGGVGKSVTAETYRAEWELEAKVGTNLNDASPDELAQDAAKG